LQAASWEPLGNAYASASMNARCHFFLARALSPARHEHQPEGTERDLIARRILLGEAVDAAMDGRIAHGLSVVGVLRAARRFGP